MDRLRRKDSRPARPSHASRQTHPAHTADLTRPEHQTCPSLVEQSFFSLPQLDYLEIRTTLGSLTPYATHFHQTFSIGIILAGGTVFTCNGEEHAVEAGDLVLIEAGSPHSCNPLAGSPRSYHMLYLDHDWCLRQAGLKPEAGLLLVPGKRVLRDGHLFAELSGLVERLRSGELEAAPDFAAVAACLLREHCAAVRSKSQKHKEYQRADVQAWPDSMERATLERGRFKVAETAKRSGCSRENFIRSFRRHTGMTPGSYNHAARMETARRMLRSGADIAETALAIGYADQSHFHRMFVKYFAATPRQYRSICSPRRFSR